MPVTCTNIVLCPGLDILQLLMKMRAALVGVADRVPVEQAHFLVEELPLLEEDMHVRCPSLKLDQRELQVKCKAEKHIIHNRLLEIVFLKL